MALRKEATSTGVAIVQADLYPRTQHDNFEPLAIDVNLTGDCQLRCDFCWGIPHEYKGVDTIEPWENLFAQAVARAERLQLPPPAAIFNGGEPLLSPLLPAALQAAKRRSMPTTLSTNGIAQERLRAVLPFIDDTAVAVDAITKAGAEAMRRRSNHHGALRRSIGSIALAQKMHKRTTVRTVISHTNKDAIPGIGPLLRQNGIDTSTIRHKLYQLTPTDYFLAAANAKAQTPRSMASPVSLDTALRTAVKTYLANPDMKFSLQLYPLTTNRYLQARPDGSAYTVAIAPERNFLPYEVELGNAFDDYDTVVENYREVAQSQPPIRIADNLLSRRFLDDQTIPLIAALATGQNASEHSRNLVSRIERCKHWLECEDGPALFHAIIDPGYRVGRFANINTNSNSDLW